MYEEDAYDEDGIYVGDQEDLSADATYFEAPAGYEYDEASNSWVAVD